MTTREKADSLNGLGEASQYQDMMLKAE
jgi:hypothetical protein